MDIRFLIKKLPQPAAMDRPIINDEQLNHFSVQLKGLNIFAEVVVFHDFLLRM